MQDINSQSMAERLIEALIEAINSKANTYVNWVLAGGQIATPFLAPREVVDYSQYVFIFQLIGAIWISMQILTHLYKFYIFIKEVLKNAKWWR